MTDSGQMDVRNGCLEIKERQFFKLFFQNFVLQSIHDVGLN